MRKQNGMTFIGMLFTISLIVAGAILVMRVVPVYFRYFTLIQSVKGLSEMPQSSFTGDPSEDIMVLKSSLNKRLEINGAEYLKENQLYIEPRGSNRFNIRVHYQVIKPFIYNVKLLFDFDHTEEVVAGSEH